MKKVAFSNEMYFTAARLIGIIQTKNIHLKLVNFVNMEFEIHKSCHFIQQDEPYLDKRTYNIVINGLLSAMKAAKRMNANGQFNELHE